MYGSDILLFDQNSCSYNIGIGNSVELELGNYRCENINKLKTMHAVIHCCRILLDNFGALAIVYLHRHCEAYICGL